jgi:hypothetical protein
MNFLTYFALLFSFFTSAHAPRPAPECKSYYDASLKLTVYSGVEKEPEYPGGAYAWGQYINKNLIEANLDPAVDCNVKIKMILDDAGQIRKAVAIHGDTEVKEPNANEKEVLRLYLKSSSWTPGKCGGNNVATEFVQSFTPCIK